jgi:hypothetical protein
MNTAKTIKSRKAESGKEPLLFNDLPRIKQVAFIKDEIAFVLDDGRVIYIPLIWSEKLSKATEAQKLHYKNHGIHVFWDEIDEIIGVKNILLGNKLFI